MSIFSGKRAIELMRLDERLVSVHVRPTPAQHANGKNRQGVLGDERRSRRRRNGREDP
jgi:hypothetical protein